MALKMHILLTNPNYKHTWIMALHLHNLGHKIYCISKSKFNFLYFSKFIEKIIIIKDPSEEDYEITCAEYSINIIIPIGFLESLSLASLMENPLLGSILPISNHEKILQASNKVKITKFVKKLSIPTPEIYDINKIDNFLQGQYILKPSKEGLIKKYFHVNDFASFNTAKKFFSTIKYSINDLIFQEFIEGVGIGYFAICEKGLPLVEYAHERIREWPSKGGYSTACKIHEDSELFFMSRKIIKSLNWRGPIMIEYRKSSANGKYYFIELNPKFWGSLELGLENGVDIIGATISIVKENYPFQSKPVFNNNKLCIAWPLDGDSFHYIISPKVIFSLFKSGTNVSTGLLRDTMYGLAKLFYLPIRIVREFIK
jgi:glutathione synthase/RimK-type ligase-like ATP-grasp enzyme